MFTNFHLADLTLFVFLKLVHSELSIDILSLGHNIHKSAENRNGSGSNSAPNAKATLTETIPINIEKKINEKEHEELYRVEHKYIRSAQTKDDSIENENQNEV